MGIRLLFVDDEPQVLAGLYRALHPLRREWEIAFAGSAPEALEILARQPFEVIVTDMRMPGMNGAELLERVRTEHPELIRIVLSGDSDSKAAVESAGLAHQYLLKPCSAEIVEDVVTRLFALRDLLTDKSLRDIISRMKSLPSVPALYAELLRVVQSPSASMDEIGKIISRDMAMAAKVLQLVNSGLFGIRGGISNPTDAVIYLGLNTIQALLLSVHAFSQFEGRDLPHFSFQGLWNHSLMVAALAERIAESLDVGARDMHADSRLIGLLHDIGHLVLAANLPGQYSRAVELAQAEGIPHWDAERRIFGTTHAEVGAYLLGLWGLPTRIVQAVAHHSAPSRYPAPAWDAFTAVHVADALDEQRREDADRAVSYLDLEYLQKLGLTDRIPGWEELHRQLSGEQRPGA